MQDFNTSDSGRITSENGAQDHFSGKPNRPLLRATLFLLLCWVSMPMSAQPEVTDQVVEAEGLISRGEFAQAAKMLRQVVKKQPDNFEVQMTLSRAYIGTGAFKNAATAARAAIDLAATDPQRALAHNGLGVALFANGEGDPEEFTEAADAFEKVLEISQGQANSARASLAEVLLQLEQDERAVELLEEYLEVDPNAPRAQRAKQLIENPLAARVAIAPSFDVATLDGEFLALDELEGSVVLLDFWATWCKPCHFAVPGLRTLAKKRDKVPFELISISTDSDEEALKRFIDENRMTWPQVWDEHGEIARDYGVRSYPTYLLINHEGVVVYRTSGWGERKDMEIRNEVNRALRAARKAGE